MPARTGVDIGGTFTDLVVVDNTTGALRVGKVLTTPKDPAQGVESGIGTLLGEPGLGPTSVRAVVQGLFAGVSRQSIPLVQRPVPAGDA